MINQSFIFTALECEARSLIRFFGLKKQQVNHPFALYKNNEIILTVTGVGKVAMAGGVAYTLALFPHIELPLLLNIGVAGHQNKAIGDLLLASKIVDQEAGTVFYPQLMGNNWPETCEIKTASKPVMKYQSDCLYDMEAAAFYEMAVRFSSSELIHCLKIISDNEDSSIDQINARLITQWIDNKMNQIELLLLRLGKLKQLITPVEPEGYSELLNGWHFTVSGEIKLKSLLRRWQVLTAGQKWHGVQNESCQNGKDILKILEKDVEALDVCL